MPGNRITVRLEGDVRDAGHVRLSDFIRQLDAIRAALRQTERVLGHSDKTSVYYRIVDLKHSSPATVVLEAVESDVAEGHDLAKKVVGTFVGSLNSIKRKGKLPSGFDYPAAEAYQGIGYPLKQHVTSITVANGRKKVSIDQNFEQRIAKAIGPDEITAGSITGTLDTLKLHNKTIFEIFPPIGPKKVYCQFRPELKSRVKSALEQYVRVHGKLRYKHWDKFPYAIDADELEIYPPDDQLPKLSDLRGIAPDLTNGLEDGEFLEKIRANAW